jgi:SpoVK/Ycf46/Vps4 family AAA+-type ATPase
MDFSKEIVYQSYTKYYQIAQKAKAEGDMATMKKSLFHAAEYLKMLSQMNTGDIAREQLERSMRMLSIAESITAPSFSKNSPSSHLAHNTTYTTSSNSNPGLVPEEISAFLDFFHPGDLEFGFEEVIGLDEAKSTVKEYVINPRLYPKEYNYDFLQSSGVLLEGPPGTGKTTFAKALSKELNQPFALVNVSGLVNCYIGETSKNIDKIFDFLRGYAAKNQCDVTVFFDELDEIAQKRGGDDKTSQAAVPALLRNLSGMKENKGLLIIANTNCKELLDKAIIDRFRRTIYIPLPDTKAREQLLRLKLKDLETKYTNIIDFNVAARETEGMNGRQITYLCDDLKHFISNSKVKGIELSDLTSHLLTLKKKHQ